MTYKILNLNQPQELASMMPQNMKSLRIKDQIKLDTRPKWLGSTKVTRSIYRTMHYGRLGVVGILDHCNLISAN